MATDFLQSLKMRNLFNGPEFGGQVNRQPLFTPPEVVIPTEPPPTRMPTSPFMDEYRKLLQNAPRREDFQQSKIGKALAIAAGTLTGATQGIPTGIATGRNIMERPYQVALEDYNSKIGRTGELANIERSDRLENRKYEMDMSKLTLDQFKTMSDIQLDDARAKELLNRIKTSGKEMKTNELTGMLEIIDKNTGQRMTIGQFAETPEAKANRDFKFFKQRYGIEQAGRKELEGIRFGNDKKLAELRQSLADKSISATQDNAAWEGANQEILMEYPDLKKQLFDQDDKGNLSLKEKYNPDVYDFYVRSIRERKGQKLGKPSTGLDPNISIPNTAPTSNTAPTVQDPVQNELRNTAIQAIKENYPNNPELLTNEEAIQEAMKQIQATAGSMETGPTVNAPEQSNIPSKNLSVPRHGRLLGKGGTGPLFNTPWKVDPSHQGPLFNNPFSRQDLPFPVRQMIDPGAF